MIHGRHENNYVTDNYYPLIHASSYTSKVVDNCTFATLAMSSSNFFEPPEALHHVANHLTNDHIYPSKSIMAITFCLLIEAYYIP